ncbi:MAG: PP2C family protein-serine/threonine phosphatase [Vicinamibacterales bacterium]
MAAPRVRSQAAVFLRTLLGTLPGRAILAGLGLKALVYLAQLATSAPSDPDFVNARDLLTLSALLTLLDTAAGVAIAVGAIYFLFRLFLIARRRLLWRVRRKLILSYVFIGVVPVMLVGAFFMLCGLLLFFNFSSYLVQAELTALDDRARLLATSAALEVQGGIGRDVAAVLDRKLKTLAPELAGASMAVVPVDRPCATASGVATLPARPPAPPSARAGPWTHLAPPTAVPSWIGCDGVSALFAYAAGGDTHVLVRAVAFPDSTAPRYGVIVDLPVEGDAIERLRRQTGVILRSITAVDRRGSSAPPANRPFETTSAPLGWVTFLDYRDWETGETQPLLVSTQVSLSGIYARIVAAQGLIGNRSIGQALLLVLLIVVGGLFLVIEVVALVVGLTLAKSITGSVHELFVGTERVRQGDFTHKIAVTAEDQLGELAQSFNSMTSSIEDLLRVSAEKKRLEEELRIAHEIQMSLLPQGPLLMPGLSVTALCVPAREVGGDYYDFLPIDDGRVGVLVADVSGKGTSAALYMAELKGLMLSLCQIHASPRDLLISANRIISAHLDPRSFITMTYAIVDRRAGTMTYARAGHTPLIHVPGPGAPSRAAQILAPDGLVLGLKIDGAGPLFERLLVEETIPLKEGDLYVFFTDGISEAMNSADDCFGETRLGRVLERHADLPPDQLRERVLREVEAFVGGAPQHDDMTMILLRVDRLPVTTTTTGARTAELAGPVK